MAEYSNEETARLKGWWASNGTAAVAGVLLGLVILVGWYGWNWYSERQDAQAADLYAQVEQGAASDNITSGLVNVVKSLENDYSGTPYASAAAMTLAAAYVRRDELDKAQTHLDWASDNASEKGMRQIARIRAARVQWAQNKPDAALKRLDAEHPPAFDALYSELAGDIHASQGKRAAAYADYQAAAKSLPQDVPSQMLEQKMAANAPVDAGNPDATAPKNPAGTSTPSTNPSASNAK